MAPNKCAVSSPIISLLLLLIQAYHLQLASPSALLLLQVGDIGANQTRAAATTNHSATHGETATKEPMPLLAADRVATSGKQAPLVVGSSVSGAGVSESRAMRADLVKKAVKKTKKKAKKVKKKLKKMLKNHKAHLHHAAHAVTHG